MVMRVVTSVYHWPRAFYCNNVVFKCICNICVKSVCFNALGWIIVGFIYVKSAVVRVMVWDRQDTSHYLNQCWPRSMMPFGVTRLQWGIIISTMPGSTNPYVMAFEAWHEFFIALNESYHINKWNVTKRYFHILFNQKSKNMFKCIIL